jgi:hypothetical protein
MSGKSPVSASDDQRAALAALASARDRGEADRARVRPSAAATSWRISSKSTLFMARCLAE